MTDNNTNQGQNTPNPEDMNADKTFTQAELDAIVQDRLAKEKKKYAEYGDLEALKAKAEKFDEIEENSKTELQKANDKAAALQAELDQLKKADKIRLIRDGVSKETGVPANLLTKDTKEDCEAQAKEIMAFAKPDGYPSVNDGGEVGNTGKLTTAEQFAKWAEKAL